MAISTFGSICRKRSITLDIPNSGEHADHMAPIEAVARNATTVSGMLGIREITRSPFATPIALNPAANDATSRCSSAYVMFAR